MGEKNPEFTWLLFAETPDIINVFEMLEICLEVRLCAWALLTINGITEGSIWKPLLGFFFPIWMGTFFSNFIIQPMQ